MLQEIVKVLGKNRLVQSLLIAGTVISSTPAYARPSTSYSPPPKKLVLAVDSPRSQSYHLVPPLQFGLDQIVLAQNEEESERPSYLPPKKKGKQKQPPAEQGAYYVDPEKKTPDEEKPAYLQPPPAQTTPPEHRESSSNAGWYIGGGLGLVALGFFMTQTAEACGGDSHHETCGEVGPQVYGGYVAMALGGLLTIGGIVDLAR